MSSEGPNTTTFQSGSLVSLKSKDAKINPSAFSILKILKINGEMSLSDLTKSAKVSKMGVLKHLTKLENAGLVEREQKHEGEMGRPKHTYRLSPRASELFPKAYTDVALCALSYIEQKEGRSGVENMLKIRQKDLFERYKEKLDNLVSLKEKVSALAELRDKEGYMAQSRSMGNTKSFEILEHNCPILALAERYGEACSTETELFKMVLGAEVHASHRAAVGDPVCRFIVRQAPSG